MAKHYGYTILVVIFSITVALARDHYDYHQHYKDFYSKWVHLKTTASDTTKENIAELHHDAMAEGTIEIPNGIAKGSTAEPLNGVTKKLSTDLQHGDTDENTTEQQLASTDVTTALIQHGSSFDDLKQKMAGSLALLISVPIVALILLCCCCYCFCKCCASMCSNDQKGTVIVSPNIVQPQPQQLPPQIIVQTVPVPQSAYHMQQYPPPAYQPTGQQYQPHHVAHEQAQRSPVSGNNEYNQKHCLPSAPPAYNPSY